MSDSVIDFRNKGYFIAEIDALRCKTLKSFLKEIAIAFQFPDYYGENMNALWECIGDLSWLKEVNYLLLIKNSALLLSEETIMTREDLLDFLREVSDDWKSVPNFPNEDEFRRKSDFIVVYL